MFYCQCSKPVRVTYCPDDNVHYPEDECQDCYEEEQFRHHVVSAFILQQRKEMKKQLQELDNQEEPPF